MQKRLLWICVLFCADFILAKSTVGRTSSYGYTRTSAGSVGGGSYLSGRTGMYYGGYSYHRRSGCRNSNTNSCGKDSSSAETERLYSFKDGTCLSHGCKEIKNLTDCVSAATAVEDNMGALYPSYLLCPAASKCHYSMSQNDVRWCETGGNSCTSEEECLCWCVIGVESSSVDVGLILGITFGALFGCCLLVAVWMYYRKQKQKATFY